MDDARKKEATGLTRRDALKASGLTLGGLALGSVAMGGSLIGCSSSSAEAEVNDNCDCPEVAACYPDTIHETQWYSYFEGLDSFHPIDPDTGKYIPPEPNEMRITFLGSGIPSPAPRRAQQMMSIFVEVGDAMGEADQFVFDCGSGVCANYNAMGIGYGRMDKIFITHLHGDHMSDLTHIYCFGPSGDRKTPLYVFSHGPSGVRNPLPPYQLYEDGTYMFCENLRAACRWHTESFSFQNTACISYPSPEEIQDAWGLPYLPTPVGDDPWGDGYAMVPIELDWTKSGEVAGDNVAYDNAQSGVKITHFPVIHARKGSIGYKLEWNGLSMIFTGDTKPEINSVGQAGSDDPENPLDVFIHEMIVPPEVWAFKSMGLDAPPENDPTFDIYKENMATVQNSSHSPQGGFGYLLSRIDPRPRLTVATHFPVADDTVACALKSVQAHFPDDPIEMGRDIIWSFDLMVLKVFAGDPKPEIEQYKGIVSDLSFSAPLRMPCSTANQATPKYHDADGKSDPYAQIDLSTQIKACDDGVCNFREDGY